MDPTRLQEQPESTIGHKPYEVHPEAPAPAAIPPEEEGRPGVKAEPGAGPAARPSGEEEEWGPEDAVFDPGA